MNTEHLYTQWLSTARKYTSNTATLKQVFDLLINAYGNSGRHYHGLQHIQTLLSDAEEQYGVSIPDEIVFAIWFHDAIYNATANDNETKSAALARKWMVELDVSENIVAKVEAMILKTANHLDAKVEDNETAFFLDADLKILGADAESYVAYAQAVRLEYSIYPDLIYNIGRKKFLKKAVSAERIFRTPRFFDRYELQAKQNLLNELNNRL